MKNKNYTCCTKLPAALIEYDLGSLGSRKYKVCSDHLKKAPWNRLGVTKKGRRRK